MKNDKIKRVEEMEKIMEKESIFTPTFVINTLISFLFYIVLVYRQGN